MFDTINSIEGFLDSTIVAPGSGNSIEQWGAMLINLMIGLSFSFSIVGLAVSAVLYILSAGNPDNTTKAWNAFIYSFVAGCITIGLIGIRIMIFNMLGVGEEFRGGPIH